MFAILETMVTNMHPYVYIWMGVMVTRIRATEHTYPLKFMDTTVNNPRITEAGHMYAII